MSTVGYADRPAVASPTAFSAFTKYQVLVGSLMIQLILGTVYGYSIFWEPLDRSVWPAVVSQAQAAQLEAAGVLAAGTVILASDDAVALELRERQMYLTFCLAICLLSFAITMIFAGRLQDLIGPRKTALIGGLLMGVGFLVAGQLDAIASASTGRLAALYCCIGLLAGVGIGFAYVCPIAALVKWFPHRKGLMSGIAVAGFGLGAFVFSQKSRIGASGYLKSHDILGLFNIHGLVCLLTIGIGALLLRNPPAGYAAPAGKKPTGTGVDLTWRQTIRTGRFYLIWLMYFSGSMAGLTVIGIIKPFAGQQLIEAATAAGGALAESARADLLLKGTAAVGMLSIFNAAGRVFWGLLSDRIGRTASLMLMYGLQGTTLLCLTSLNTTTALAIGAGLVGFNYGGCFALFPSLTADLFGSKNLGANYGWVFTSYGAAGVAGLWSGGIVYTQTGSYFIAFALAAGFCFLTVLLAVVLARILKQQKALAA